MDPDQTLKEMREHGAEILRIFDTCPNGHLDEDDLQTVADEAEQLADGLRNLDTWILKGGFLPAEWRR